MWTTPTSPERREAIGRAARAVVRLATDPTAANPARRANHIVNDASLYNDVEAWDAVATPLEGELLTGPRYGDHSVTYRAY